MICVKEGCMGADPTQEFKKVLKVVAQEALRTITSHHYKKGNMES
jgi:hypothetical protein